MLLVVVSLRFSVRVASYCVIVLLCPAVFCHSVVLSVWVVVVSLCCSVRVASCCVIVLFCMTGICVTAWFCVAGCCHSCSVWLAVVPLCCCVHVVACCVTMFCVAGCFATELFCPCGLLWCHCVVLCLVVLPL